MFSAKNGDGGKEVRLTDKICQAGTKLIVDDP